MGGDASNESITRYPDIAAGLKSVGDKQDKVIGVKGQIVGFDDNGRMVAQDASGFNPGGGGGGEGGDVEDGSVTSVNGHTGDVSLTYQDVGAPSSEAFLAHTENDNKHITLEEKEVLQSSMKITYASYLPPFTSITSSIAAYAIGGGIIVAISNFGYASCSYDGFTWSAPVFTGIGDRTETDYQFSSGKPFIIYGNGLFVYTHSGTSSISYSRDGINWSVVSNALQNANPSAISFVDGTFAVHCFKYSISFTSQDAVHWTLRYNNQPSEIITFAYGNGHYVRISSQEVSASDDGLNWTVSMSFDVDNVNSMAFLTPILFGDNKFIFTVDIERWDASTGETIDSSMNTYVSEDGFTWDYLDCTPVSMHPFWGIDPQGGVDTEYCYGYFNGNFVYENSGSVYYSDDGHIWKRSKKVAGYRLFKILMFFEGKYIGITGSKETAIYYSFDLENWNQQVPVSLGSGAGTDITSEFNVACNVPTRPIVRNITLYASEWGAGGTQDVSVRGVSRKEEWQIIQVCPKSDSISAYYNSGVMCTSQVDNGLVFTAKSIPSENLDVYVVIHPLAYN